MINSQFYYNDDNQIIYFEIFGHAESTPRGQDDLVCAGVSAIVFGILNSLDISENNIDINIEENFIEIKVNFFLEKNQIILETLFNSLKTIEERNEKFIKIYKQIVN